MKTLHVHLAVRDLQESLRFYTALFAAEPAVVKTDYAKWKLQDPRVNFAISQRGAEPGLDHLGIQVESDAELAQMNQRLQAAALPVTSQIGGSCCYVQADKHWTADPQGIAWESFHSLKDVPTFNGVDEPANDTQTAACCAGQSCGPQPAETDTDRACCA